jgi:hypothetical protein
MVSNRRRYDPYKGFNFRVLSVATLAGFGVFGIVKKLLQMRRNKDRPPIEEIPAGSRPIEGVGTSTVGFIGIVPKRTRQARPEASRMRKGPRKTRGGKP